jgi:hypothetical protein
MNSQIQTSNQPPLIHSAAPITVKEVDTDNIFETVVTIDNFKTKLGNIVLRIYHLSLGLLRLFGNLFYNPFRKTRNSQKEYCFTQQYNDSCHLSPLQNLKILQTIKEANYDLSKVAFHNRREWLGENQELLQTWHTAIGKLTEEGGKEKFPALYKYLEGSFNKAPVFPHFYDKNGKRPFNGFKGLLEFAELPYFLIDIEEVQNVSFRVCGKRLDFSDMISLEDLGLKTGFVKDKEGIKLYNKETKTFDPIDDLEWVILTTDNDDIVITLDEDNLPEGARKTYALPKPGHKVHMRNIKGLGFQQMGVDKDLGAGLKLKNSKGEEHTYIIFQMSLLKMLFLATGVDSDNNVIDENHHLHQAYQEFKGIMSSDETNLWNEKNLSKEMVLQYHLANIFKKDPALKRKAMATVDTLSAHWSNYAKLHKGGFYNENGIQMSGKDTKDYVLGQDQALAYYFMQNIRLAWYSALNPRVPLKAMEVGFPEFMGESFHQFIKCKFNEKISFKTPKGKVETVTFMGVWDKLLPLIKEEAGEREDLMSFDDHGWVISFDEKMIKLQSQKTNIHDKALLKRLGFAGIESWLSSDLDLWYSRARKKVKHIQPSTAQKQEQPKQRES